jgi:putative intracellular protease/amidase
MQEDHMSKKVLVVLTSHEDLGSTGAKTGFWLEEFARPYYVFIDKGYGVTLASPAGGRPPADPTSAQPEWQTDATKRLENDALAQAAIENTKRLSEINVNDYDAIFFPGGHGPMWDLAADEITAALVNSFYEAGKPVGAVCHGPAALIKAVDKNGSSVLSGKKVTGFTNTEETAVGLEKVVPFLLEDKLKELGGNYSCGNDWGEHVVVDGNLITGQNPASAGAVAKAVIDSLGSLAD